MILIIAYDFSDRKDTKIKYMMHSALKKIISYDIQL